MLYNLLDLHDPWDKLFSLSEAAEMWKVDESTIRKAISRGQLIDGKDCRKFGKQWVITLDAMVKFGGLKGYEPWSVYLTELRKERGS